MIRTIADLDGRSPSEIRNLAKAKAIEAANAAEEYTRQGQVYEIVNSEVFRSIMWSLIAEAHRPVGVD